jgi:hypothetical protein
LNIYRAENTEENRCNFSKARTEYKSCIRNKKFEYNKKQTQKLEDMRLKNAKEYWKMLKGAKSEQKSNILKADNFLDYFKSVNDPDSIFFQPDDDISNLNNRYLNCELQDMFSELSTIITEDEIIKACKELKTGKSGGPDLFLNEFFKHGSHVLVSFFSKLFNSILDHGYYPDKWSDSFIVPIFKKGCIDDVCNYRGISLLSTLGKLFTKILNTRLDNWAENYNVYVEAQAGFRKNMGTTDNLFILHGAITHILNQNKSLFVAFIDFKKAFDFIVRDILWYKLIKYGVRGKILNVILSMYSKLKSKIKYNNSVSESYSCTLGVAQGECISPFLFSMYLNDLEETLVLKGYEGLDMDMLKLYLLMYADDICLFSKSADGLQQGLNFLQDYCDKWKLTVNTVKTKIMVFKKGGRTRRGLRFTYNNVEIEIVSEFSYLGIIFSSGGSFSKTHDALAGQALKALFKLKSYLYKFTNVSVSHKLDLFDKLILPILLYGSEVSGFSNAEQLEKIHLKFCKQLLGVRQQTPNSFIYGELGRMPIKQHRIISAVRYWLKITNFTDTKYVKCMYKRMLIDMDDIPSKTNWAKQVKTILDSLGFSDVWIYGVGHPDLFLNIFKQRMKDHFIQSWNEILNISSKADSYRLFSDFSFKEYLNIVNISKFRHELTRLRTSSHRLNVETGRWHKPRPIPRNDRKCELCNKLEDEFHFLLECRLYCAYRKKYINSYYWRNPNIPKFISLLNSSNKTEILNLATFVYKSVQLRNETLLSNNL